MTNFSTEYMQNKNISSKLIQLVGADS